MAVASLVLAVVAAASATPRAQAPVAPDLHSRGVNVVLGDLSAVFGYVTPSGASAAEAERARVRGHLRFVHDLLAAVDTSSWPAERRAARARNLERLQAYALAGEFPHNDGHADRYRPTFVDRAGTLCAVGALFAADRGRDAAVRVAADYKYAFVAQIHDGELATWQQSSGLSAAELAMIQPSYSEPPDGPGEHVWLPFGLLDRVQIAPPRVTATSELSSGDRYGSTSLTLHAQASTSCDCNIGAYGTLPMSIDMTDPPSGVAMAPAPARMGSRTSLGTADIGIFGGKEAWTGNMTVYRLGMLLPTASADQGRLVASARVGDSVLELPRTMGVRTSTSWLQRWRDLIGFDHVRHSLRADLGLDVAVEYANQLHDRVVHVVPRGGFGMLVAGTHGTVSIDTALALDPLVDFAPRLRWSAGITGRLARRDGHGWFIQPALTLATVRTPEGWAGTLALELAASGRPKSRY